jgi:hypothetical protein
MVKAPGAVPIRQKPTMMSSTIPLEMNAADFNELSEIEKER